MICGCLLGSWDAYTVPYLPNMLDTYIYRGSRSISGCWRHTTWWGRGSRGWPWTRSCSPARSSPRPCWRASCCAGWGCICRRLWRWRSVCWPCWWSRKTLRARSKSKWKEKKLNVLKSNAQHTTHVIICYEETQDSSNKFIYIYMLVMNYWSFI